MRRDKKTTQLMKNFEVVDCWKVMTKNIMIDFIIESTKRASVNTFILSFFCYTQRNACVYVFFLSRLLQADDKNSFGSEFKKILE